MFRDSASETPPNAMNDTDDPQQAGELPHENPNRPREYHGARTVIAGIGVVLAVAAALWLTLLQPSNGGDDTGGVVELPAELLVDGRTVGNRIDSLAPDFELRTLDGESLRLSDLRGRPVLINFWASWCGPCRREVPALIRAQDRWSEHGFMVVGVNIEESDGQAMDFANEFGINYVVPMDYRGEVFRAYGGGGINGPPRSFFIDPDGVIIRIYAGQAPDELIAEHAREFVEAYSSSQ